MEHCCCSQWDKHIPCHHNCCCSGVHRDVIRHVGVTGLHLIIATAAAVIFLQLLELQTSLDFASTSTTAAADGSKLLMPDLQTSLDFILTINTAAAVGVTYSCVTSNIVGFRLLEYHCCCSGGYLQLRDIQTSLDFAFSSTTAAADGFPMMSSDHQTSLDFILSRLLLQWRFHTSSLDLLTSWDVSAFVSAANTIISAAAESLMEPKFNLALFIPAVVERIWVWNRTVEVEKNSRPIKNSGRSSPTKTYTANKQNAFSRRKDRCVRGKSSHPQC